MGISMSRFNPTSSNNIYLGLSAVLALGWFAASSIIFAFPHDSRTSKRMEVVRSIVFEIITFTLLAYTIGLLITGQDRAFDKRMEQIERDMSALDKINMRRGGGNSGLDTKTILKELAKLRQSPSTCGSSS